MPATAASPRIDALPLSRRILSVLLAVNYAMGVGILVLLAATFVNRDFFMTALGVGGANRELILEMRAIMVFGVLAVPITAVVLTQLLAIVDSVGRGDPFVTENAERLQTIAWSVLALEVLHIVIGVVANRIVFNGQPIDVEWKLSGTRWLSIPLLFVLARVFAEGVRMREELDGTV